MSCENCLCPFHELPDEDNPFCDPAVQCMVTDAVKEVRFRQGEVLFRKGQSSTNLYALTHGIVKICCTTPDGREQIVGISSPGNLLVGLQAVEDDHYEYSAIAVTDGAACRISHRAMLAKMKQRPDLSMSLVAALNAQLAHSRELMRVMGHKCAAAKIASFLSLLVPRAGHMNHPFHLPFSRMEIASLLGLSEETVCRQMARLKRRGVIYAPRGRIEILDWKQLRTVAEEAA